MFEGVDTMLHYNWPSGGLSDYIAFRMLYI